MNPHVPKILVVSVGKDKNWKWYSTRSENSKFSWEFRFVPHDNSLRRVVAAALIGRRFRNYDIIISQDYFITFGIALRCLFSAPRTKHIAFGFNQSRRLLKSTSKIVNILVDRIFASVSLFVTHSVVEQDHFATLHNIVKSKFHFTHWTYGLPETRGEKRQKCSHYICMIGRNNRDWTTFIETAKLVDIQFIAVTDGADLGNVPRNVTIHANLPMLECIELIRSAKINLTLLKDDERGAGHITSVIAMTAGIPQIVTQSNSLQEYFIDGLHGYSVVSKSADDVARKIGLILSDSNLHTQMSLNALTYAKKWFSEDYGSLQLSTIVESVLCDKVLDATDPQWQTEFMADLERASKFRIRFALDQ